MCRSQLVFDFRKRYCRVELVWQSAPSYRWQLGLCFLSLLSRKALARPEHCDGSAVCLALRGPAPPSHLLLSMASQHSPWMNIPEMVAMDFDVKPSHLHFSSLPRFSVSLPSVPSFILKNEKESLRVIGHRALFKLVSFMKKKKQGNPKYLG